jgi:hypothetical protein
MLRPLSDDRTDEDRLPPSLDERTEPPPRSPPPRLPPPSLSLPSRSANAVPADNSNATIVPTADVRMRFVICIIHVPPRARTTLRSSDALSNQKLIAPEMPRHSGPLGGSRTSNGASPLNR